MLVPHTPAPAGGYPVIAWAHGTVGLGDDCTPSALPRTPRDNEYLSHWLSQGYVVVASDYAGLGTPGLMSYLNSVTTAHGVIDSVVAAHKMPLSLSPKWAIVGQSQGGGAAVASARWATEFSAGSGLDYRGVVATGTPANIQKFVAQAGPDLQLPELGPVANAYTAYILAALREARPDPMSTTCCHRPVSAADRAETVCVHPLTDELAHLSPAAMFTKPLLSIPGIEDALNEFMGTPVTGYDRPIFFLGVGLLDRDVPPASTLAFYDQLVANNQNVELKVYPEEDHSGTVLASLAELDALPAQRLRTLSRLGAAAVDEYREPVEDAGESEIVRMRGVIGAVVGLAGRRADPGRPAGNAGHEGRCPAAGRPAATTDRRIHHCPRPRRATRSRSGIPSRRSRRWVRATVHLQIRQPDAVEGAQFVFVLGHHPRAERWPCGGHTDDPSVAGQHRPVLVAMAETLSRQDIPVSSVRGICW